MSEHVDISNVSLEDIIKLLESDCEITLTPQATASLLKLLREFAALRKPPSQPPIKCELTAAEARERAMQPQPQPISNGERHVVNVPNDNSKPSVPQPPGEPSNTALALEWMNGGGGRMRWEPPPGW